jgi:hypothetical protein
MVAGMVMYLYFQIGIWQTLFYKFTYGKTIFRKKTGGSKRSYLCVVMIKDTPVNNT